MVDHAACRAALPQWLAGDLPSDEASRVAEHLAGCAACQRERDEWSEIAGAMRALAGSATPLLSEAVAWARLRDAVATPPTWRYLVDLMRAQGRRVARDVALVSLALLLGVILVSLAPIAWPQRVTIVSFLAPLLATLGGLALFTETGGDSARELEATLPLRGWLVTLSRIGLSYGVIVLVNLLLIVLARVMDPQFSLTAALGMWVAPLLCLSGLTALAAAASGTTVAIAVAAVLWALRAVAQSVTFVVAPLVAYEGFWRSGVWPTLVATLALVGALTLVSRRARQAE